MVHRGVRYVRRVHALILVEVSSELYLADKDVELILHCLTQREVVVPLLQQYYHIGTMHVLFLYTQLFHSALVPYCPSPRMFRGIDFLPPVYYELLYHA